MNDDTTGRTTGSGDDPLAQAAAAVRDEPPSREGWEDTRRSVMQRVRSSVRPGRTFTVETRPDGAITQVNERVLVAMLRGHVAVPGSVSVDDVRTEVDGDRCTAVEIDVVARYGQDLEELSQRLLARTREVLAAVLLETADDVQVHVEVVDVETDHLDL